MNYFVVILSCLLILQPLAHAQDDFESTFDQELQSAQPEPNFESEFTPTLQADPLTQPVVVERDAPDNISPDREINRYPKDDSLFKKPKGPVQGGKVRVPHPRAADGLLRINKDGSYQYKTAMKEKSQSGTFKVSSMTAPDIRGDESSITYKSMYGSDDLVGVGFDYEWMPFKGFGSLGLQIGTGFWTASGKGSFKRNPAEKAEETYTLFIIPLSAFVNYRFEFVRRQWIVPFVSGGGTFYGMAEIRNDGKSPGFGGAPAVGGGGGVMVSLSRMDSESAFRMSEEYGIADMWLLLEARALKGLDQETDFTSQTINAGISLDF